MEENLDRLQSLVAKSNLVATAGEFVPKTNIGLEQEKCEQFDNDYSASRYYSDQNNSCNKSGNNNLSKPNVALAGSSRDVSCLNLPNSSGIQVDKASSSSANERSGVFVSENKEHRHTRHNNSGKYFNNNNNYNNKWRKAEFGNGKKRSDGGHSGIEFQRDSSSKESNKAKAEHKNNGNRFLNSVKSYEKDGTVYFVNYNDFNQHENGSWRKKNKFYDSGQCQTYLPRVRNYGDSARGNISFANNYVTGKKSELYKNVGRYKFKQYYCEKNESKENVNEKISLCKSKDDDKNSEGFEKNNQRELLIDLLTCGVLECLVCCEQIHQNSSVWSCSNCHHVLHLKCTVKWAKSSKSDFGWRCPACQNVSSTVPYEYYCFCGKIKDPDWNHHDCPHSCGEVCGKTHGKSCPHKCMLLCHPGPCPQCTATITKACGCQRTTKTVQCCSDEVVVCSNVCGKELNCLIHSCPRKCHVDSCGECQELVAQDCFCGKEHRDVKCTIEAIGVQNYVCGDICNKKLSCENHFCGLICHKGECPKCELTPDLVKFCPCGKTELTALKTEERRLCTDPIPTCSSVCGKPLGCSQPGNPHVCQGKCHEGSCPVCPLEVMVKCRCGHMSKMIPCSELESGANNIRCDKRCSKKRSCGKHKCNQLCCTGVDHECPLPCNRLLQCGLHRCEETCHRGHCKPCLRASFDELSCECGAQVIFPPVPCGTRRPPCDRPCTRTHNCDHPSTHSCHSESQCPPCTVLTKKYCHGRHELRKAVPCYQESFSCGLPCGKEIVCGRHKCILSCHSGNCLKDGQSCLQPCPVPRPVCGHICGAPCHDGPCPVDIPCKEMVRVTCECGHRYTSRACHDNASEYQRIATARLASKMADLQAGQSIELNDVIGASKKLSYKTLECNDECKLIERNRRLAIALQIRNPDLSAKLTPRYSEYLKNWAKKDPRFCQTIHDKLTNLVQLAKQSKQKSRSFSFDPMNREKRHFIHEYCEHFGCESVAYDQEPKRNVVATALKDKSWLPSMSIIEFLHKENSPRKVPAPVLVKTMTPTLQRTMEILPSKILPNHQAEQGPQEGTSGTNNEPQIDYFDWTSQNS